MLIRLARNCPNAPGHSTRGAFRHFPALSRQFRALSNDFKAVSGAPARHWQSMVGRLHAPGRRVL
eukprot:15467761-Alexandrium_andersonii.AAC.1